MNVIDVLKQNPRYVFYYFDFDDKTVLKNINQAAQKIDKNFNATSDDTVVSIVVNNFITFFVNKKKKPWEIQICELEALLAADDKDNIVYLTKINKYNVVGIDVNTYINKYKKFVAMLIDDKYFKNVNTKEDIVALSYKTGFPQKILEYRAKDLNIFLTSEYL